MQKAYDNAVKQEYRRMGRLYKRIRAISERKHCFFITLTYDEKHYKLAETMNAKEWAKKNLSYYYGNDDIGKDNERYHHHIFGNFQARPNYKDLQKTWKYGALNLKPFRGNHGSDKAIAKYIDKIAKHSYKLGAKTVIKSQRV